VPPLVRIFKCASGVKVPVSIEFVLSLSLFFFVFVDEKHAWLKLDRWTFLSEMSFPYGVRLTPFMDGF